MIKDFRTTQIKELKLNLENALNVINTSLAVRERALVDIGSYDSYEAQRRDSVLDPETYYYFKIFDKGCHISKTCYCYNLESGTWYRNSKVSKYSVKVFGFYPESVKTDFDPKLLDFNNISFGCYSTLNEVLPLFYKICFDLIKLLEN